LKEGFVTILRSRFRGLITAACSAVIGVGCDDAFLTSRPADVPVHPNAPAAAPASQPALIHARVVASTPEEAGKYLVLIGGCNDCHTPGFMQRGLDVPESQWLTGVNVAWRGPWGDSLSSNLRAFVKVFPEQLFVQVMRTRKTKPPMPWTAVNSMSDDDLKSIYAYIKSLKPVGKVIKLKDPNRPYVDLMPKFPAGTTQPAASAAPAAPGAPAPAP
jgi:cytochrome c553